MTLSRLGAASLALLALSISGSVLAQGVIPDAAVSGSPPETIDLLVKREVAEIGEAPLERCDEHEDVARLSGEIVVCRKRGDAPEMFDKEDFENRFAEKTKFRGDPKTPDFILDCHDQGWPVGCIRMGSVPPPVLMIDVQALPEAPPGSDADRIARGLAPRGREGQSGMVRIDELILPPAPEFAKGSVEVSPAGSEEPEAQP